MNMPSMILTPKESSLSSLSRRPEVKRVNAAAANDALDIISEYLLQNGQIGATKLPLVKELRSFFLMQSEVENKSAASAAANNMNSNINNNSGNINSNSNSNGNNGLLLGVGAPTLAPVPGNTAAPVFVHSTTTLPTHSKSGMSAPNVLSFSASNPMSGSAMVPMLDSAQSSLNLPADGLRAMEEVLNSHQVQQHTHQHQ
ncbi:hypothetical protein BG011_003439 [Mortierella polycephala]|uniref:Uncharacterized protein n=1 Tax=Mortierella polycephala TaxID=41804 RepID=A0A9P6Q504_9FUNG|nr:hypothetical protein BG011_003439 [Mortierella polycephala]